MDVREIQISDLRVAYRQAEMDLSSRFCTAEWKTVAPGVAN